MLMQIISFLVPPVLLCSAAATIIFLVLFVMAKTSHRETSKKYRNYLLVSMITLFVTVVAWGFAGYMACFGYGCAPETISYRSCPLAAKKYIDEHDLRSLELISCRSKDISITDGRVAQMVEIAGDCVMGGDVCSSLKSFSALLVDGKFYDVPLAWQLPHIPGSHSICNGDAGGGAFRYDKDDEAIHRELEITASGTMRYRYTLDGYHGGYDSEYFQGDEGGYACRRTGVMTADLDGGMYTSKNHLCLKLLNILCIAPSPNHMRLNDVAPPKRRHWQMIQLFRFFRIANKRFEA